VEEREEENKEEREEAEEREEVTVANNAKENAKENAEVTVEEWEEENAEEREEVNEEDMEEENAEEREEVNEEDMEEVNNEDSEEVVMEEREKVIEDGMEEVNMEDREEVIEDESEEDEDYVQEEDEDLGDSEFDGLVEEDWDWTHEVPSHTFTQEKNDATQVYASQEPTKATDFEEAHNVDSDVLDTPPGSEDDGEEFNYPKFKIPDCGDQVRFELGMRFASKGLIRDAVKSFAMEKIKNLHIKKNDSKRVVVRCDMNCPFYMRFSKRVGNEYWQLVSFSDDHTCHRTAKNRQATTEWLAKKFIPLLRHTPEMRPKGLIAEALENWGVKLSSAQAYRAKTRALELLQGAMTE
jgi:hypothetical protein